jgi:hypothetical protein
MCQLLPLQLWARSQGIVSILDGAFAKKIFCKAFTVSALGVFQPFVLLLAGFMCSHALRCALRRRLPATSVAA